MQTPTQSGVRAFYGEPGGPATTGALVNLPYPMKIAWDLNQKIVQFRCHVLCEKAFENIFAKTLQHYGLPRIQQLGLDLFGGCYNFRKMRGGSAWSMHSWGIAIDLDPARNSLYQTSGPKNTKGRPSKPAEFSKPEYEPFWKIVESEGGVSLGRQRNYDWMHFQFARLG